MARIIECVPNCSEGRNKEVIEYIADAVRSVPGVALMDYSSDENHNRSVFTIVGDPDQMGEAAFRFAKACELLKDPTLRVKDVANRVGYENISYFGSVFTKRYHMTPNEYRKKYL